MRQWFAGDHHFGHGNVIRYCNRPFTDAEEMDREMKARWNNRVKPDDVVWYLGDLIFTREWQDVLDLLDELNGQKHIIIGNHDHLIRDHRDDPDLTSRVLSVQNYAEHRVGRQRLILCHYPFLTWNACHHGTWNLHGHCHGNLGDRHPGMRLDMSVDCWDFAPASWDEVRARMGTRRPFSADIPDGEER